MSQSDKACEDGQDEVEVLRARVGELEVERQRLLDAENALRESNQRFRTLIENLADAVFAHDLEGHLVMVNQAACENSGYTREELLKLTVADIDAGAVARDDRIRFWFKLRPGEAVTFQVVHRRKDGSTYPAEVRLNRIDLDGRPAILAVARDISERVRIQRDYQNLFERMIDGFALHEIILDEEGEPVDYRFLAVNPAFEKQTGLTADQIVGRTVREVLHEDVDYWIRVYGDVALTGKAVHFERYSRELGRHYEITAFRPAERRFACIFEDITARKQAEAERDRLEAELRQAQKMEAVGQLAGGVAHDFNNLLTVIIGNTDLMAALLKKAAPAQTVETCQTAIEQIQQAGQRGAALTQQLLGFSRRQPPTLTTFDPNTVVKNMVEMLRRLIGEGIDIELVQAPDAHFLRGDPAQIEQAIMNLGVNARDAMPRGGTIWIETANVELDESYVASRIDARPGPYLMISVRDTGVGMNQEILPHIFEPFFTTKEIGKGTGLGLATVYANVRQAGGHITVETAPGQGTTFRMYFPAQPRLERNDAANHAQPAAAVGGTVLLCEDETMVRRLAANELRQAGYTVLEARSGEDAIRVADAHDGPLHLVLTDVIMPGMDGRELVSRLKQRHAGFGVLYMSGYTGDIIDGETLIQNGQDFIAKPFGIDALLDRVQAILAGREPKPD
jgi:PAS domain S-box-containing protein